MTLVNDTHRLIGTLVERGFSEEQAEAITDAIQEIDLTGIPTRAELTRRFDGIEHQLKELELRMTIKLGGLLTAGIGLLAIFRFFP